MIRIRIFFCLLIALFLSCSSGDSVFNKTDCLLSDKIVSSSDSSIFFNIPIGWSLLKDNSRLGKNQLLFHDENINFIMNLIELKTPYNVRELIKEEGLERISEISFAMKNNLANDSLILSSIPRGSKINGIKISEYKYKDLRNSNSSRTIIFDTGRRYFDFTISSIVDLKLQKISIDSLFCLHNSVFVSMNWKY